MLMLSGAVISSFFTSLKLGDVRDFVADRREPHTEAKRP